MDPVYVEIRYKYIFSDLDNPSHLLRNTFNGSIIVWKSRKLIPRKAAPDKPH